MDDGARTAPDVTTPRACACESSCVEEGLVNVHRPCGTARRDGHKNNESVQQAKR